MTMRNDTFVKTGWLALFAMALIIVAPLISIALQKDPMSAMPGMHHDMSAMPKAHMHHEMGAMHSDHNDPPVMMPVGHAEACGYCVLMAHVPGVILLAILFLCARISPERPIPLCRRVHFRRFSPWQWPDTRAPPYLSALPVSDNSVVRASDTTTFCFY